MIADAAATRPLAPGRARALEIHKGERTLRVLDVQQCVLAAFPVSIGGPKDPLPLGPMKITSEVKNPRFTYDPVLIRTSKAGKSKIDIQPGPNNPVGNLWFGLGKPHRAFTARPTRRGWAAPRPTAACT